MPLLDISYVTETMLNVIRYSIEESGLWTGNMPLVFAEPPNRNNLDGIGFYLYHINENAHYKNLLPPQYENSPIRNTPMSLNLFYQLSANDSDDLGEAPKKEQRMMGAAMRGLHDYPEITDTTLVNAKLVMDNLILGRANNFKVSLIPILPSESVHYWTAGDSAIKLSAYYEVSVVFLEPEESVRRISRVSSFGLSVFAMGAPKIFSSQSIITFSAPPGQSGLRTIKLSPAQASPNSGTEDSTIILTGAGLLGDKVELLLLHSRWDEPLVADASWNVVSTGEQLTFTVQEAIALPGGGSLDILPGIYAIQIRTTKSNNGSEVVFTSNQCPISIVPRIDSITPDVGMPDEFDVVGYIFNFAVPDPTPINPANTRALQIEILLGEIPLASILTTPLNVGQYVVGPASGQLRFRLPAGLTSGDILPLRVFVEGVESLPRWIVVP